MASPLPEIPVWQGNLRVYFYDTDAGGVVHNIAYLRMVEWARTELADSLGWPLATMKEDPRGCPVVVRTEIDYRIPARLGDELTVTSEVTAMKRARFFVETRITRESSADLICRSYQTLAVVDLATGKPKPLPADWLQQWPERKV
jgi:acyl-CoA thioester hydrolase